MAGPSDRERQDRERQQLSSVAESYRKAAPYIAASTSLVVSVGGFAALGYWLDRKLGHRVPWLLLVGAVVGSIGGFVSFFKTVLGAKKGS